MKSRVRVAGHPVHPMFVMFPIALLPIMLGLDALYAFLGDEAFWRIGFWAALAGLGTALVAIVTGIPDMAAIPDGTKAHRKGIFHAVVGVTIALVYAAGLWARWDAGTDRFALAAGIDAVGLLLVSVQGWLGGELVYKHHVGVKTAREGGEPVTPEGAAARRAARADARRPGA